ncbi:hypothetical protein AVEN_156966-1 [Araneus ventricosus]|uniref:Helitron helicase-like domain-containing protein n=1 Tax=Araneus ventricosus TaxID=182803 RepID=A0A4Y2S379_ARAVE|nr:hypothetical protein AVEN_156966-1 [Araneus ventricosus]
MQQGLYLEAFRYDPTKDHWLHPKAAIGKMNVICKYCRAKKFKCETLAMCCSNGKIKLPSFDQPLEPLYSFISGVNLESTHFLQNIRKYNACFQMTSFGTTTVVREEGFMPTFKIQGQIYHGIGSLLPLQDRTPQILQIYFIVEESVETNQRCKSISGTRGEIALDIKGYCTNITLWFNYLKCP